MVYKIWPPLMPNLLLPSPYLLSSSPTGLVVPPTHQALSSLWAIALPVLSDQNGFYSDILMVCSFTCILPLNPMCHSPQGFPWSSYLKLQFPHLSLLHKLYHSIHTKCPE